MLFVLLSKKKKYSPQRRKERKGFYCFFSYTVNRYLFTARCVITSRFDKQQS